MSFASATFVLYEGRMRTSVAIDSNIFWDGYRVENRQAVADCQVGERAFVQHWGYNTGSNQKIRLLTDPIVELHFPSRSDQGQQHSN